MVISTNRSREKMNHNVENLIRTDAPTAERAPVPDLGNANSRPPAPTGFVQPPNFYAPNYYLQRPPAFPFNAASSAAVLLQDFQPANTYPDSGHFIWVPTSNAPSNTRSVAPTNDAEIFFTSEQVMCLMRQRTFSNFRGGRGGRGYPYRGYPYHGYRRNNPYYR